MTDLRNQRRMAASIIKCGANRVWMDQDRIDEIAKAVTKDDIRVLVKGKAIKSKQQKGISHGRKKHIAEQKEKVAEGIMVLEKEQNMHVFQEKEGGY